MKKNELYIMILVLIISRLIALWILPLFDDAFITMKYSFNIANGLGFVFNANDKLLGTTSPLWGLINSVWFYLGLDGIILLRVFNLILDICLFVFVSKYFVLKENKIASYIFLLFFSLTPIIARIAGGGMEVNLYALLGFASIYFYSKQDYVIALIISSLLYFIRPEAVLLVALIGIFHIVEYKKYRVSLKLSLIPISIISIGVFLVYSYYHTLIPQSVIAKSLYGRDTIFIVFKTIFLKDPIIAILLPLTLLSYKLMKSNKPLLMINIWSFIYFASYMISRQKVFSWYPYIILITVLLNASLYIANYLKKYDNERFANKFSFGILSIIVLVSFGSLFLFGQSKVTKNIFNELENYQTNLSDSSKSLLAWDVGAIGFYSKCKVIDGDGLITKLPRRLLDISETIRIYNPDYIFLITLDSNIIKVNNTNNYVPVRRFSKDNSKDFNSHLAKNDMQWVQDYILYKKK